MENTSFLQMILREFSVILRMPVIFLLIVMILFSVFCIGWIITEAIRERKHLNESMPRLLDRIKLGGEPLEDCISGSGLLQRQKDLLLELLRHPQFSEDERASFADNLIEEEEAHYNRILKWTDTVAKLAPMAGLLGTLIPLGPGIIALGQGDAETLSQSMLTAFDTTVAGLVVAGICVVISTLRRGWYDGYMSNLHTLVDFILEEEKKCH